MTYALNVCNIDAEKRIQGAIMLHARIATLLSQLWQRSGLGTIAYSKLHHVSIPTFTDSILLGGEWTLHTST